MSHNICTVNGIASMAYVGNTPWHKLGQHVEGQGMTAQECISKAGLGYSVEKCPVYTAVSPTAMVPVPDRYATVRMDNMTPLGLVSDRYSIVQNCEAFSFFDAITGTGEAMYQTAGALGKGETVWLLAKLPQDIGVPGDAVGSYLLLTNSHDGKRSLTAKFTAVRVVCNNTLTFALEGREKSVTIRHTSSAHQALAEAHRLLGIVAREQEAAHDMIVQMLDTQMERENMMNATRNLFDISPTVKNIRDATLVSTKTLNMVNGVLDRTYRGKGNDGRTLWSWVNGVAEWVDYERGGHGGGSGKAESALFGSGRLVKEKSMTIAHDILLSSQTPLHCV